MTGIFISYRRDDSAAITGRIFDRLSAHFGAGQVFMDIDSIPIGQDFREHIGETLARCQVMLAVVGPDWTGPAPAEQRRRIDDPADLVRLELEGGLARKIPVVPVLVEGASTPSPLELPESLRGFSYRNAA
ncbi:MAG TPA: toll/interleukin-1 receptor domain-containing protein, partial [Kiloniellales bacterium]|nr:toll/interleukin-1 receptor domain-containing protein [Kiloniellales bacterium]